MNKKIFLILLLSLTFSCADTNTSLEKMRTTLTYYYHALLGNIDDTIKCEKNCKHLEKKIIKKNSLRLIFTLKSTKEHIFRLSLNARGNIHLPKLGKRLELTFSRQSSDTVTNRQIDTQNENIITDDKIRVGLKYYFLNTKNTTSFTKLGFKLRSPFGFYQELSLEKRFLIYHDILLFTKGSLYYYLNHTYLAKSVRLNFYKSIDKIHLLEQANEWYANSQNRNKKHIVTHLKLHHYFNKKNRLTYWISYALLKENSSSYKKDWQGVSVSYIHYLSKWLFIQTIPRILQKKENNFHAQYALSVSLGMTLGTL